MGEIWSSLSVCQLDLKITECMYWLTQIFDKKNNSINTIFHFVEEAMEVGESCLIHSVNGKSRATAVLVAYLMRKYQWNLSKCLEFIVDKK